MTIMGTVLSGPTDPRSVRAICAMLLIPVLALALLAGCSGGDDASSAESTAAGTSADTGTPDTTDTTDSSSGAASSVAEAIEATATAAPTATPAPTPTPSAIDIYRELSPSMAFIETAEMTSGSGVLIEGGFVLTDHHVVEFADTVRVVFPNGTEILEAPVYAQDPHSDLALVGPLDTALPEVPLAGVEPGPAGDVVFLLGYPDEIDTYPEVTITEGIVSRRRYMELHDYEFVQADALIAPGQSGGVLVNSSGEIIGISGLRFGDADFALVMAAPTVRREVDRLLTDAVDFTRPPLGENITIDVPSGRAKGLILETDGRVRIDAQSTGDIALELLTLSGNFPFDSETVVDYFLESAPFVENYVDESADGSELLDVDVDPGRYVLSVTSFSSTDLEVELDSNVTLYDIAEEDDGASLPIGEPVRGLFDHPTDTDLWTLDLSEGDRVRIQVDAITDTVVVVRRGGRAVAAADDSGTGLYGTSVDFEFEVNRTDTYDVEIGRFGVDTAGYIVQVDILN